MAELTDIRETVRERYAAAARTAAEGAYDQARALESESGCCGSGQLTASPADETGVFGARLYDENTRRGRTASRNQRPSDAGSRPRSPICTKVRQFSTSGQAPARTC